MKRKSFLQSSAAVIGGSLLPFSSLAVNNKKKAIRFAHLTDMHLQPGPIPEAGVAKAMQHVQQLSKPVDFMVNGGDAIMDSLNADKQKTQTQWDLFKGLLKKENSLPVYHTIGNHDVWGWFVKENKPDNDRLYGKVWVVETLELPKRYYSFTNHNWHFIVLDSTQLNPAGGYIAKLDEEQFSWLQEELKTVPPGKFICIISHIPILAVCAGLFSNKNEANGDLIIKRNLMHTDFFALKSLFLRYPKIRACISGHIHLQEELEYLGVKYYCNGAVSGNWWRPPYSFQEFEPAYAIMELFEDGSSKRTIVRYQVN